MADHLTDERQGAQTQIARRHELTRPEQAVEAWTREEIETELVVAFLSQASRGAEWVPPERVRVCALMGSAVLDFCEALLPPGLTEVQVFSLCGSVKVRVPEDLDVEVTGHAFLGDFKQRDRVGRARRLLRRTLRAARGEGGEEEDEAPLLRVTGLALLGSVRVERH